MDRKIDPYFEEMKSLMEASEEGVIFLDDEACVQRYTPTATNIFHFKSRMKDARLITSNIVLNTKT